MSLQITTAFVQQYRDNVVHLSQQKGSRLRGTVRIADVTGKNYFFERIGATAAIERLGRHTDTPLVSTPHSRRMVTLRTFEWADLVDHADKVRLLIDPQSEYAVAGGNAMARRSDDLIIEAAEGNAWAGESGTEAVALPATQLIANGGVGLTVEKVIQAAEILNLSDVDPDEPRYLVYGPRQLTNMLGETEVTSSDYASIKALVEGKINSWMGFSWIMSNRLRLDTYRYVLAYTRSSMGLAIGSDITVSIDKRPDKSNSMQVFLTFDMGATRVEDEKMVTIACVE